MTANVMAGDREKSMATETKNRPGTSRSGRGPFPDDGTSIAFCRFLSRFKYRRRLFRGCAHAGKGLEIIKRLGLMLDESDIGALRIVADLQKMRGIEPYAPIINTVARALEEYDFDLAKKI